MFNRVCRALVAAVLLSACGATAAPVAEPTAAPTAPAVPTITPLPTSPTATPVTAPTAVIGATFAPVKRAVWETTAGSDQLVGDCPNGSIVPPYGPVLITPADTGLSWRDVQQATYVFAGDANPNVFRYAGPNGRNDGTITMTLTFNDATTFSMQALYVKNDTPGCTHVYDYAGVFKFER
jgi:hypothetical protein